MYIHMMVGFIVFTLTMVLGMMAWGGMYDDFAMLLNPHSFFAFPVLYLILFLGGSGLLARCLLTRSSWGTRRALTVKKVHKTISYFTILAGAGAIGTGVAHYRSKDTHRSDVPIEWIILPTYACILLSLECAYRKCCYKKEK